MFLISAGRLFHSLGAATERLGHQVSWYAQCVGRYQQSRIPGPKGAFHLSELTGQTIPVVMRISLLIKTTQPDMLNPK